MNTPPAPRSPAPQHEPEVPRAGRWLIVGGLLLLALPVTGAFYFFAVVAAMGCFMHCGEADPRPVLASLLLLGAAAMAGAWAGLVPWAMGRRDLVVRTAVISGLVVVGAFAVTTLLG